MKIYALYERPHWSIPVAAYSRKETAEKERLDKIVDLYTDSKDLWSQDKFYDIFEENVTKLYGDADKTPEDWEAENDPLASDDNFIKYCHEYDYPAKKLKLTDDQLRKIYDILTTWEEPYYSIDELELIN